jgi:hypothetical protein
LLVLATKRKGVALQTESDQALQMLCFGRVHTALPVPNGLLADVKELAQRSLGQAHARAQPRTIVPEGVFPTVHNTLLLEAVI